MNPSLILGILMSLSMPTETNSNAIVSCQSKAECLSAVKVPIVIEVNEFTEESAKVFEDEMNKAQHTGQTIIPIVIDSYGGSVYSLLRMVSIVQASKIPVATIVEGKAMSCGAMLFMMGKEGYRFAGHQATILIHDVSSMAGGKVKDLKVTADEAERLNTIVFSITSKNVGHPADYFTKIIKERGHTDWFISVEEAKRLNIVNKIGIPEFRTKIDVKYILE